MPINVLEEAESIHGLSEDDSARAAALIAIQLVYIETELKDTRNAVGQISGFMLKIKEALEKK